MRDYQKMGAALVRYHEDFRPDVQAGPVAPAGVFELLGLEMVDWPGRGLSDETPWQYREGEYMHAGDYDALIADPEGYFRRVLLPRFGSAFAPLAGLNPFTDFMEAASMPFQLLPFADPALVEGVRRLADAAREALAWLAASREAGADVSARLGIPPEIAGSVKAPYDVLADTLRGMRGIARDLLQRPDKLLEAAKRLVAPMVSLGTRQAAWSPSPLVVFWLHKGADGFMSDEQFRTFYWPTLKAVLAGLIEEGVVPLLFAQGSYLSRLDVIADGDLPSGSVLWAFDQTDMATAGAKLGGYACIAGNVPTALLALGTPAEVEKYVTGLLEACAGRGGFVLRSGSALDDARPENLAAMFETGRRWKG